MPTSEDHPVRIYTIWLRHNNRREMQPDDTFTANPSGIWQELAAMEEFGGLAAAGFPAAYRASTGWHTGCDYGDRVHRDGYDDQIVLSNSSTRKASANTSSRRSEQSIVSSCGARDM